MNLLKAQIQREKIEKETSITSPRQQKTNEQKTNEQLLQDIRSLEEQNATLRFQLRKLKNINTQHKNKHKFRLNKQ
jgi:hypothetical protein